MFFISIIALFEMYKNGFVFLTINYSTPFRLSLYWTFMPQLSDLFPSASSKVLNICCSGIFKYYDIVNKLHYGYNFKIHFLTESHRRCGNLFDITTCSDYRTFLKKRLIYNAKLLKELIQGSSNSRTVEKFLFN